MKVFSGVLVFSLAFVTLSCAADGRPSDTLHLSRAKALVRAKEAASKHGYNPSKFLVDNFISHLRDDGKTWVFLFRCLPDPSPPDCGFSVEVVRDTGVAEVHSLL